MKIKLVYTFLLTTISVCTAIQAQAQITVDSVIVHLANNSRPVHNVIVQNSSDETAYVLVEVNNVPNPHDSVGIEVPTTDLLASPRAFSIEPRGQRTVRLLLKTQPTDKERVFRVAFVPQDRGFGQEYKKTIEGRTAVVRVLSGMGILVFGDPIKPEVHLEWKRDGDTISFTNQGNVHTHLGNGKSCTPTETCTSLPAKRLYAGSKYSITTPPENTVSYLREDAVSGNYINLTINPAVDPKPSE